MKIKIHPNGKNETESNPIEFEFIIRIKAK